MKFRVSLCTNSRTGLSWTVCCSVHTTVEGFFFSLKTVEMQIADNEVNCAGVGDGGTAELKSNYK